MWCYALINQGTGPVTQWLNLEQALERPLSEPTWIHVNTATCDATRLALLKAHLKSRAPRHQLQRLFKPPDEKGMNRPSLDEHDQALYVRFLVHVHLKIDSPQVTVHVMVVNQWLISVTSQVVPALDSLHKNLKRGITSWPRLGSVGFAAELLDMLVDQYALLLDHVDDELMRLEHRIQQGQRKLEPKLFHLQRHILQLRHVAYQHQEVCYWLCNRDIAIIDQAPNTELVSNAFRRLYDHMSRVSNWCEFARDSLAGSTTLYLGLIANQTNDVLRTLTIFTLFFMAPTLIAGIYGMNFDHMPELRWPYGYLMSLVLMVAVTGILWRFFVKKRWL